MQLRVINPRLACLKLDDGTVIQTNATALITLPSGEELMLEYNKPLATVTHHTLRADVNTASELWQTVEFFTDESRMII